MIFFELRFAVASDLRFEVAAIHFTILGHFFDSP